MGTCRYQSFTFRIVPRDHSRAGRTVTSCTLSAPTVFLVRTSTLLASRAPLTTSETGTSTPSVFDSRSAPSFLRRESTDETNSAGHYCTGARYLCTSSQAPRRVSG
ncbi:hypothetical protein B0H12DRAFT_1127047 [Mycena haematopus]|nr:hypothetical protein B0H12DRAFT_1127047 [Mycena haematopus]